MRAGIERRKDANFYLIEMSSDCDVLTSLLNSWGTGGEDIVKKFPSPTNGPAYCCNTAGIGCNLNYQVTYL